ncbi:hypothetical protein PS712_06046 [Pseudomonas fluorescens]|uniref:Uncharacterized protein n=1 Tax=Pseudomonas fluorescens TaxID=294 RepID=A0A5E7G0T9_PSEFL|nr:hypothetical protein PS712_06046 [Pseudomonas fluorescens]
MGRGQGLGIDQAFLPLGDRRLRSHADEHGRARVTVLARRANEFWLRRFTHQHRLAVTLALGPQPLVKAHRLQGHHRRAPIGRGIGHTVGADALHISQRHGGVVWAKIHVHLAAIVTLGKHRVVADFIGPRALRRRPARAAATAIGLDIPERGQRWLRMRGLRHRADDPDQRGEGVMVFGGDLGQHTVGRIHENQGVGAALAFVHQQGLRQQRNQGALAMAHDADGFIR